MQNQTALSKSKVPFSCWEGIMYPIITILGKDFSMYVIMSVIGLLIAGFIFCYRIKKNGGDESDATLFIMPVGIGMLIGGSILYAITNISLFPMLLDVNNFGEFLDVLGIIFGGSVFYGGLFGAILFGSVYIKMFKLPKVLYMDNSALFAPIFHGFARIGCFFGGCCYGIESAFGFCAHENKYTLIGEVRRFPIQLLESLLNFLIAIVIYLLMKKGRLKGRLFYVYLILYALVRIFDEFLRGDQIRGFVFGISTSQIISIIILATVPFILAKSNVEDNVV